MTRPPVNPGVALLIPEYDVVWCPRHLEPYRAQWPLGGPAGTMRLLQAAWDMDAVRHTAGDEAPENVAAALIRFAPLCCFVANSDLVMVYRDTVPL